MSTPTSSLFEISLEKVYQNIVIPKIYEKMKFRQFFYIYLYLSSIFLFFYILQYLYNILWVFFMFLLSHISRTNVL